jgi:oxygen-independent coproporphyrinogen-3 oxidase
MQDDSLSIYIHVPFCARKCPYCHFFSTVGTEQDFDRYLESLLIEIDTKKSCFDRREIISVYFGGGTPFLIGTDRLCTILQAIASISAITKAEITIEANPDSTSKDQLQVCFAAGFNRLSIGTQSFNNDILQKLRRPHTAQRNKEIIAEALEVGFSNISIDLMYDIPDLTLDIWKDTLTQAVLLPVTHISIYNLEIEPKTAWYRIKRQLQAKMPLPDVSLNMYQCAQEILQEHSFKQYEISAFARSSRRSIHNIGYWQGREFLGFGPAAFSYFRKTRFSNVPNLAKYSHSLTTGQSPILTEAISTPHELVREFLAIGLRMNDGVSLSALQNKFGMADSGLLSTIQHLLDIQLLTYNGDLLLLTNQGRIVYDSIASELI